jgi:hypothetical protein
MLQIMELTKSAKRVLYMGTPIPEDLDKIKSLTKQEWEADEWFIVPLRASDNLVSRNYKVWHDNVLEQMPQQLIGKSLLKNHDWDNVENSTGFILDAFLANDSLPEYSQDKMYKNLSFIKDKGYKCVYCIAAIHASKAQDIMDIKTMRISKCSTGGVLSEVDIICPNCSAEYGREVSFFEIDEYGNYICPHQIPGGYDYDEDDELADYAIWNGVFDGVELSLVVCGNLFKAEIIR